ncbi:MAG: hypothetical protein ACI3Y5_08170 [Prevotella sp.]
MSNYEHEIMAFATTVRQLLLKYEKMEGELCELKARLADEERKSKEMELLATAAKHDYDMLKSARIVELTNNDIDETRKRVNKLIRDVEKCITLLTEQQNNTQK